MKNKHLISWTILVLLALMTWGCGSSRDSSGSITGDSGDVVATAETLGVNNCANCHSAATPETLSWLASTHGNSNGSMRYGEEPHGEGSSCTECHNQLLDGNKLDQAFPTDLQIGTDDGTPTGSPIYAGVSRDIVTCESCHGGGQFHNGVGPIPYTRPDWEQCVACHDHEGKRHEDSFGNLASNVGASAHNNSDNLHASTTRCQRCHTAEGSVELAQFTGDSDAMHAADDTDPIDLEENLHAVTCAACHIPHDDSGRWEEFITLDYSLDTTGDGTADTDYTGPWDPNGNGAPDQFDFCTSCHTYYNQDGILIGSGSAASGTAPHYHNTAWFRVIPTTHYDDPTTGNTGGFGPSNTLVEGYVVREDSANPCFDCHGHELRTNTRRSRDTASADEETPEDYGYTIHTEWASSGHAAGLLEVKYAAADANPVTASRGDADYEAQGQAQVDAVQAAAASDDSSNGGFTHYNWDGSSFNSCQKCHTSTGFMNYAADPINYDPLNNDFSHLEGWSTDPAVGSAQNELLYCWGCHDNPQTGTFRVSDPVTADYSFGGEPVVFPESGNSNTCNVCHGGRGNNETVSTSSRFAGHHAPAAATLYSELTHVGGEYVGQTYLKPSFYAHDQIDVNGSGPCAGCHMDGETPNHEFAVVEKDDTGVITSIASSICVDCHDGEHALFVAQDQVGTTQDIWNGSASVPTVVTQAMADAAVAELEHESESYQEAGVLLNDLLNQTNGLTNYTAAVIDETNVSDDDRRAFQNAKLPTEEKGAYAHNRYYVKQLLYDSIDWVEDGVIDGTIADYSITYPDAYVWLGSGTRPTAPQF